MKITKNLANCYPSLIYQVLTNKDIFINFVKNDKKFRGENIRFILLDEIGKSRISEDISFDQIKESLSVL